MSLDPLAERIATAGVGLGALGIQWGRRPAAHRPCQITERDVRLLAFLHDFNYATTTTLAALFWGRLGTAAQERLKLLHDIGFLDRLRPRVSRTQGSCEWIYRLTALGWRLLLDADAAVDGHDYEPAELTSISYVEHDVQVSALVAQLAALAARAAGCSGPLIDAAPFRIVGPRGGAIDPRYETAAPNPSKYADDAPTFVRLEAAVRGILKPDATLLWGPLDAPQVAVLIEYDRTRRATKQLDRLRRYDWFLAEGWRESRYAALPTEPIVLVVTASERQLEPFVRAADGALTAWSSNDSPGHRAHAFHPGREQVGFTTRDRLLAGDGELLQVPPTPPSERHGRDRACAPAGYTLELDRIGVTADGAGA